VITIRFKDIGRRKVTWEIKLDQMPTEPILERAVRKKGALLSHDISVSVQPGDTAGPVFAGMHHVGDWEVVPQ
jgi:hypothetical protein